MAQTKFISLPDGKRVNTDLLMLYSNDGAGNLTYTPQGSSNQSYTGSAAEVNQITQNIDTKVGLTDVSAQLITVASIAPASGPHGAATVCVITGTNFIAETTVLINGNPCPNVALLSATQLQVTVPFSAAGGPYDVNVNGVILPAAYNYT